MQITICGGGNAAHVLAGLLAVRSELRVHVYAPYGDEAQRWQQGMAARGGIAVVAPEGTRVGRPQRVSADPAQVVPGSRLVLLALPAFAHEITLRAIAPYLEDDVWVGALPARGGFNWCVEDTLGTEERSEVVSGAGPVGEPTADGRRPTADGQLFGGRRSAVGGRYPYFGLQTLPWACRIRQYGCEVAILGTKAEVDLAAWPPHRVEEIATLLSGLLEIRLRSTTGFLSLTLGNAGQLIHPGVMYGLFRDWDGRPYSEAPLFYQGINAGIADILQRLSDEVQALRAALEGRFLHLDLSDVRPLDEWLRRSYGDAIADPSSLRSCFVTNRSYAGLRAPMRPAEGGLVPDFGSRYLAEDVPYGLVVTRGIAELAGVPTPTIDQVITWAQERLRKEYLVDGRLQGHDIRASRAPQRYGIERLGDVVRDA